MTGRTAAACRLAALLGFALLPLAPAATEQVRGIIVSEARIPSDAAYENTVALTIEEMVVIELAEETPFLTAVRLELHLSNALKKYFDSFALAVYKSVSPAPTRERRFFEGTRAFFQYLPYLNRIQVVIPVGDQEPQESREPPPLGTYRLEQPIRRDEFPLLVTMVPLAKGIPASIAEEKIYVTLKPVLRKRGLLELALRYPPGAESQPVRLFLDQREVPVPQGALELPAGMHQLRVLSTAFKEVSTTFAVESGKTVRVEVDLEELVGVLSVDAPRGAEVFLDGSKLPDAGAEVPLKEGSHLVRVKVGDYSLSKKFTARAGKHYHIAVVFDIIVNEE